MHTEAQPQVALVTGASCGLGAEVARQLAQNGAQVIVAYRDNRDDADAVVADIRGAGGQASALETDILDGDSISAMSDGIRRQFGHIDTLVLNATAVPVSADAKVAKRDAQRKFVAAALDLMAPGSRIVFVTSNQAHFYPNKGVLKGYEPILASKRDDESDLYAMRPEISRRGVACTVVTGDFLEAAEDSPEAQALAHQHDPAVPQVAAAVALATVQPHPASIVYADTSAPAANPGAILPDRLLSQLATWHESTAVGRKVREFANVS